MTERERALREIQALAFALQETVLYLDCHPRNTAALRFYRDTMRRYAERVRAYEAAYGMLSPLTPYTDVPERERWDWSTEAWPWETADETERPSGEV